MAKPNKSTGALSESPSHLMHRVLQTALDLYVEEVGAGGLTQRQYAVLAAAAERDGATQAELVRITGIDRSTLADMAARMATKGLLERQKSSLDARAMIVRLSDKGREALEAARPRVDAADRRILERLPKAKRETFLALLTAFTEAADGAEAEAKAAAKAEAKAAAKAEKKAAKAEKKALKAARKLDVSPTPKSGKKKKKDKAEKAGKADAAPAADEPSGE